MRLPITLATLLLLGACNANPERDATDAPPAATMDATIGAAVDALLTTAATDFHAHRPPEPSQFRAVRAGTLATPDGPNQPLICGEFLPLQTDGNAQWTLFATIKTSGYEQWLGTGALAFCQNPAVSWQPGDWTPTLQQKFDALR
ncbi:MAG: hypothetical protein IT478_16630 [Xanthomonadales bacterium]|nr:hypothetical protein [Xanthomonadales bacterium]MCC6562986.1 hypothetical protein [Xanthomonadales bacterium]